MRFPRDPTTCRRGFLSRLGGGRGGKPLDDITHQRKTHHAPDNARSNKHCAKPTIVALGGKRCEQLLNSPPRATGHVSVPGFGDYDAAADPDTDRHDKCPHHKSRAAASGGSQRTSLPFLEAAGGGGGLGRPAPPCAAGRRQGPRPPLLARLSAPVAQAPRPEI